MDAGDEFRKELNRNDGLALLAVVALSSHKLTEELAWRVIDRGCMWKYGSGQLFS
jgi:hypothetical protein